MGWVEIRDHDEAKTVAFENRSGAYLKVREHRIAEKRRLQTVMA
jgi:hypothetical protein